MRTLLALASLSFLGCATARVPVRTAEVPPPAPSAADVARELAESVETQLGGPEASAPVAALGTWVPYQAATKSLLGQASLASRGVFASLSVPTSGQCITFSGGKICGNGSGELDLYGAGLTQILLVSGTTYLQNTTEARGVIQFNATSVPSGTNAIALLANGARLDVGTGSNDYFSSDGSGISTPGTLSFVGGTISGDVALSNIVGTAGSGTGISTNASGYLRPFVHSITVARTALTAAATTQDITIWTLPAKTRVLRVVENVTAAFDDAAGPISAVTTTCGSSAGGTQFLASGSVFATGVLGDALAELGSAVHPTTLADIPSVSGTTTVTCRWTSTGGNLSTLTTGSSTFYIEGVVYP